MTGQLVITADGSHSVLSEKYNEHYHSRHGALQESKHVFINAGLFQKMKLQNEISILEVGFGTGLNTLLTMIESETHQLVINYTAIEKFPLSETVAKALNFCKISDYKNCATLFDDLITCNWNTFVALTPLFNLKKLKQDIEYFKAEDEFDIIYFDAFAPSAQPELWTDLIFAAMYKALKKGGILVTYCAKGEVKRILKKSGFIVESLPGPAGKREMTRGFKNNTV